jgi:hypothetical protein
LGESRVKRVIVAGLSLRRREAESGAVVALRCADGKVQILQSGSFISAFVALRSSAPMATLMMIYAALFGLI